MGNSVKDIQGRLTGYISDLKELEETANKATLDDEKRRIVDKILKYIDEEDLDALIEDEEGQNIIGAARRFSEDENAFVDIGLVLGIISFLIWVLEALKKQADKYNYIPRWKTRDAGNYRYVLEGDYFHDSLNKYLKEKRLRRRNTSRKKKGDIGFVFGNRITYKDGTHRITVRGIAPFEKFGKKYSEDNIEEYFDKLISDASTITNARTLKSKYFTTKIRGKSCKLYNDGFSKKLARTRQEYRANFLKRQFLGMFFFEENLLTHAFETGRIIENVLKSLNADREKAGRKKIYKENFGIKQFPKFLLIEKDQFEYLDKIFNTFGYKFDEIQEKLSRDRIPIVLCADNKRGGNCMCVGKHPTYGYQRMRYYKELKKTRALTIRDAITKYPNVIRRKILN